jgi:CO/xanthine dehydrogenase FAD-binding subunit
MLAETRGSILSGGTDVFPALGEGPFSTPVIDISALSEIRGIRVEDDYIHIGGRTTWSDILRAALPRGFDGLKAAAREVGGVQIQNQGTIAGNICNASPAADGVAALMALDAKVTLASAVGMRMISLSEFITGNRQTLRKPTEILISVQIPRRLENAATIFLKLGARRYLVISIVMVAITLLADEHDLIAEALICVGSCSAKAARLTELESTLKGQPARSALSGVLRDSHLSPLSPIDDIRSTAAYRNDAAKTLLKRGLHACVEKLA